MNDNELIFKYITREVDAKILADLNGTTYIGLLIRLDSLSVKLRSTDTKKLEKYKAEQQELLDEAVRMLDETEEKILQLEKQQDALEKKYEQIADEIKRGDLSRFKKAVYTRRQAEKRARQKKENS